MKLGRVGPIGQEIPVVVDGGRYLDLRGVTPDIDPTFFDRRRDAACREAHAGGFLPLLEVDPGIRIGAPIARPGAVAVHRHELRGARRRDRRAAARRAGAVLQGAEHGRRPERRQC